MFFVDHFLRFLTAVSWSAARFICFFFLIIPSLYFGSSCFLIEIFILGSLMGLLLVLKKQIELRISAYDLPNVAVKQHFDST